jgi:phosphopantothenoylcysteine decarboxylase/phosphopantothenate--cysteine ligase
MGYALAEELASRGAEVTLVSGPVSIQPAHPAIRLVKTTSASEMYDACAAEKDYDVAIMAAAVADFTPVAPAAQKIKKGAGEGLTVALKKTEDILASLGKEKGEKQLLVGFALETSNEKENARKKLGKGADLIVLNSLNDTGAGFGKETNKITIISKWGWEKDFETKPKTEVAKDIVDVISELLK